MVKTEKLANELVNLQSNCVGLYQHYSDSRIELVIEDNESTFVTVTIGDLFGLSTTTFGKSSARPIVYFPDGKSLSDMMKNPFSFNAWFVENITNNK